MTALPSPGFSPAKMVRLGHHLVAHVPGGELWWSGRNYYAVPTSTNEEPPSTGQAGLGEDFYDAWVAMGARLGVDPMAIAKVAHAESGMSPTAFHPGSNAGGLIGFMPSILSGLGWRGSPEEFRQLSATQQIPYVEAYYRPYAAQLAGGDEGLVYAANFLPGRLGRALNGQPLTSAGEGFYESNRILDRDRDGHITTTDLRTHLAIQNQGARWTAIERELWARGAGRRGGAVVRTETSSPWLPLVLVGTLAAGAYYLYSTQDGRRLRAAASRRLAPLVPSW